MKPIIITLAVLFTTSFTMARSQAPRLLSAPEEMSFTINDEPYVDDIPFDTWMVSKTSHPEAMMMELPEEEYVDDIPFNTRLIAQKVMLNQVMEEGEEQNVNDIPFSTEKVYNDIRLQKWMAVWHDEKNVDDIPFDTRYMICWCSDTHQVMVVDPVPSNMHHTSIKGMNNVDFMKVTEKYLENLNERIQEMDNLSLEYPF